MMNNNNLRNNFKINANNGGVNQNNNQINLVRQQFNNYNNKQNINNSRIDPRNLQKLNKEQLKEQFNGPARTEMNNENNEISDELADQIYEIVEKKYPEEAGKITGMIKDMGIETMNRLVSKKEDLNEMIEKAYKMIK